MRGRKRFFCASVPNCEQHRRAHRQAERHQRRAAGEAELLLEDVALHHVPAGAAPFLRPRRRDPALLREDAVPAQQLFAREVRPCPSAPRAGSPPARRAPRRGTPALRGSSSGPLKMVTPPSATMHCPVMKAAAGEARNTAMPPMSRGSPRRRSGVASIALARALLVFPQRAGELGLHQPGRDGVDAHVLRAPLGGEVAHQVVVGGLRDAVGADHRVGEDAADRADQR